MPPAPSRPLISNRPSCVPATSIPKPLPVLRAPISPSMARCRRIASAGPRATGRPWRNAVSSAMAVTLFFNPQSRAQLTRWLLEEIGIPYTLQPVGYEDGSMRTPEFLALSPLGKIPCILDEGQPVTEQIAVCLNLADKYK